MLGNWTKFICYTNSNGSLIYIYRYCITVVFWFLTLCQNEQMYTHFQRLWIFSAPWWETNESSQETSHCEVSSCKACICYMLISFVSVIILLHLYPVVIHCTSQQSCVQIIHQQDSEMKGRLTKKNIMAWYPLLLGTRVWFLHIH